MARERPRRKGRRGGSAGLGHPPRRRPGGVGRHRDRAQVVGDEILDRRRAPRHDRPLRHHPAIGDQIVPPPRRPAGRDHIFGLHPRDRVVEIIGRRRRPAHRHPLVLGIIGQGLASEAPGRLAPHEDAPGVAALFARHPGGRVERCIARRHPRSRGLVAIAVVAERRVGHPAHRAGDGGNRVRLQAASYWQERVRPALVRRLGHGDRRLEGRGQDRLVAGVVKQLGHCARPRLGPLIRPCRWVFPSPWRSTRRAGSKLQTWLICGQGLHIRIAWATPTRPLWSGSARHPTGCSFLRLPGVTTNEQLAPSTPVDRDRQGQDVSASLFVLQDHGEPEKFQQ